MKKNIFFGSIFIILISIIFYGCKSPDTSSSNTITYNNIKFTNIQNPSLVEEDINKIGVKIGDYEGSDVYSINGESKANWIYLDSQSMSDSPVGLYKSSDVKLNTLDEFHADEIKILKVSTTNQENVFNSTDGNIISKIIESIDKGKNTSIKNINIDKELTIEIMSKKYPNLMYRYDYIESKAGKYYISYNNSNTEVNDVINKYTSQQ
jgi:hypothetical protein